MILTENVPENKKKGWKKGKKQTKAHIKKRIESRRLRNPEWHTQEQRAAMSEQRRGATKSEETRLKMSESHIGKKGGLRKSTNMSIAMRRDDVQRKLRKKRKLKKEEGLKTTEEGEDDFFETATKLREAEKAHLRRRTAERRYRD